MADARLDVLNRDAMEKLDEVDDEACMKYVYQARCWPGTPSFYPRMTGQQLLSKPALLLRAPPTAPPRPPMGLARNVASGPGKGGRVGFLSRSKYVTH